jgi:hypothetical protein
MPFLRWIHRTVPRTVLAGALVTSLAACSLLIDKNTVQCTTPADCEALSPGAGLVCEQSSCVPRIVTTSGDSGPDVDAAPPECTKNAECMDREASASGRAAICVKGKCQRIDVPGVCLSQVLPTDAREDLRNDNVLLIAGFAPIINTNTLNDSAVRSFNLALKELQKVSGIPNGPGGASRPVVMMLCGSESNIVEQSVSHAVRDLQVPAMIARFNQTNMAKFVTNYAVQQGTFTLNPQDTTVPLKQLPVNELLWHLLGTPEDVAVAYRPLVKRAETYVRSRKGGSTAPIKVALLTIQSPTEEAISATIRTGPTVFGGGGSPTDPSKAVVFNDGKSTSANGADFLRVDIPAEELGGSPDYPKAIDDLAAFAPDIVIALTTDEIDKILDPLEAKLKTLYPSAPLPVWLLSVRNAYPELPAYISNTKNELPDAKRKRFLGIQYAGSAEPEQYATWLESMKSTYAGVDPSEYSASENYYDAVYWLAYGLYAAGPGAATTGDSIKRGVRKLLNGPRVYPGAAGQISNTFSQLTAVREAEFIGALGPLDIDPGTGAQQSVGAVYCYVQDGSTFVPKYNVLRYNPATKELDGTFDCFIGF